jgi:hypothetical protein
MSSTATIDDTTSLVNDSLQLFEEVSDAQSIQQIRALNVEYQAEAVRIQESLCQLIQDYCQQAEQMEHANDTRTQSKEQHQERLHSVLESQDKVRHAISNLEQERTYVSMAKCIDIEYSSSCLHSFNQSCNHSIKHD